LRHNHICYYGYSAKYEKIFNPWFFIVKIGHFLLLQRNDSSAADAGIVVVL
jgi:hypothetical protein